MHVDRRDREEDARFRRVLAGVQRPSRYIGGEWNSVVKDLRSVEVTFGLAFPDVYEIGMSHLGFRILYALLNAREDTAAERVFCPWTDYAAALRERREPLRTLETGTPLRSLDVVGFSLQYEMSFTSVLEMLDLAGIPLRSASRGEGDPLVVAGGPVVFNVEPLADFLDLVFVGDGEALLPEFLDRLKALKREGAPRSARIRELAAIPGLYAPSLYPTEREPERGLRVPADGGLAPYPVRRRILYDLDRFPFPDRILVPHGEIVHDRVSVELMRGCPVGCRFCQAGYVYRPARERHPDSVRETVLRSLRATGYDEFSLASLNSGEYGAIRPLLLDLMDRLEPDSVSASLSSLHASTLTRDLAEAASRVRRSGFTIAPEAGTQRLRDVVNKNLDEPRILEACRVAFEAGWEQIKLYFMIGLPTETDEDVDAIADLAREIAAVGRRAKAGRRTEITVSASSFVPKAVTPFQWRGMERVESLRRKQERIATRLRRGVRFKGHDAEVTFLESVFSRGDRDLGNVLERAWRAGARLDGWSERFRPDVWRSAFREEGIDPERYAHGDWDPEAPLPWDALDSGVAKVWLAAELARALEGRTLPACGPAVCHGCASFARECTSGVVATSRGRVPGPAAAAPGGGGGRERGDGPRYRYRARFAKTGRMRYLGHLDLARALLRGMRRAGIRFVYSQGFNPKPRVSFGPALPVGLSSEGEYLDFDAASRLDATAAIEALNASLPEGLRFLALREIRRDAPGLAEAVRAARYRARAEDGVDVGAALETFRSRGPATVRRERDGKVRIFLLDREVLDLRRLEEQEIRFTLSLGGHDAAVRPDEIVREIFGERAPEIDVLREELLLEWGGKLLNPMLAAAVADDAERSPR